MHENGTQDNVDIKDNKRTAELAPPYLQQKMDIKTHCQGCISWISCIIFGMAVRMFGHRVAESKYFP